MVKDQLSIPPLIEKIAKNQTAFFRNIILQLGDKDVVKRRSAVWSVYSENIQSAIPIVCDLLHDENIDVRLSAIAVCGQLQVESVLTEIDKYINSFSKCEKEAALYAKEDICFGKLSVPILQKISCEFPEVKDAIENFAKARTFNQRTPSMNSLIISIKNNYPQPLVLFSQLINIPYQRLQCLLAQEIAHINTDYCRQILVSLFERANSKVRQQLCKQFIQYNYREAISQLISELQTSENVQLIETYIFTLGKLHAQQAVQVLTTKKHLFPQKVAQALATICIESSFSTLLFFLQTNDQIVSLFFKNVINQLISKKIEQENEQKWQELLQNPDAQVDMQEYTEKICLPVVVVEIIEKKSQICVEFTAQMERTIEQVKTTLYTINGCVVFEQNGKALRVERQIQNELSYE
ncbi:HEAT repeat domain-containing protein [Candidatus Uabimicrobium sp. HlEnr_7]|uniref:HEAT repeat domain-containing protein n=1 Tax=Candidatus Uabimicrobium helgolandensis TaxID=3095367 RepID=UPI003556F013